MAAERAGWWPEVECPQRAGSGMPCMIAASPQCLDLDLLRDRTAAPARACISIFEYLR